MHSMKQIQVLDCTLRDGGYCNKWRFGKNNIKKIIMGLEDSGAEIIECGFLSHKIEYDEECSKYCDLGQAERFIVNGENRHKYVCMVNYGEVDIEKFPHYVGGHISGIRVAFHKVNMNDALELCKKIKEKGYQVYIQPMVVLDYSDEEFLQLVHKANDIDPYAFYIVDSFGSMKRQDLVHIYYMAINNLNDNIWIGFHSHNNMQLSYANSQALLELQANRKLIIDVSIFGMGRGAGNLNTELFEQFLNDNCNKQYKVSPLLSIYDEILSKFYNERSWGYSLANYLSATYNCHPNYASFLDEKNTLTVVDMNNIFMQLESRKKNKFDKEYIEALYLQYMSQNSIKQKDIEEFTKILRERKVLIIASGKSSSLEKEKIVKFIKENNCLVISINAEYQYYCSDFIFVSNIRRYKQIDKSLLKKMIVTSNILCDEAYLMIDYDRFTNNYEGVVDNAALMLIKYLISEGVKEINIAGLDGYSHNLEDNYADEQMIIRASKEGLDKKNKGLNNFIHEVSVNTNIVFVTTNKYIK